MRLGSWGQPLGSAVGHVRELHFDQAMTGALKGVSHAWSGAGNVQHYQCFLLPSSMNASPRYHQLVGHACRQPAASLWGFVVSRARVCPILARLLHTCIDVWSLSCSALRAGMRRAAAHGAQACALPPDTAAEAVCRGSCHVRDYAAHDRHPHGRQLQGGGSLGHHSHARQCILLPGGLSVLICHAHGCCLAYQPSALLANRQRMTCNRRHAGHKRRCCWRSAQIGLKCSRHDNDMLVLAGACVIVSSRKRML